MYVRDVLDEKARRAIRYSMLVNLCGKPGSYRAVNWVVELNNLYTKVYIRYLNV